MRPNLNTSFPVYIPGVRLSVPMEIKVVENVVTLNGEKLGEVVLPEPTPEAPAEVSEDVAQEPLVVADEVAEETAPVETEEPAVPEITWSSAMTKSELLAIASQLGLTEVTSSNTKAEILSALDATKQ